MKSARSLYRFASHFAASYATAIPAVMYRLTASCLLDPKGSQQFVHDVLDARDFRDPDRVLKSVNVTDIFPDNGEVTLKGRYYLSATSETSQPREIGSLAHIVRSLKPGLIFEIGTFIGRTTRLFALNSPPETRILTLDLPQDQVSHQIGQDYLGTPEAAKITQLAGDSRTFDYSPYHGLCDFVWVDGNHDYEFVAADTAHACRLCRPGAWIGWHDYRHTAWWSGVTRHLRELQPKFKDLYHLRGTSICVGRWDPGDQG